VKDTNRLISFQDNILLCQQHCCPDHFKHLDKKAIKIDIWLTFLLNDYVEKKLRVNVLYIQTQKQPK